MKAPNTTKLDIFYAIVIGIGLICILYSTIFKKSILNMYIVVDSVEESPYTWTERNKNITKEYDI